MHTSRKANLVIFLDGKEAEDWRAMRSDRELAEADAAERDQLDLMREGE